jgi:asparagine synthase (glutamine-hydrolysing)
VCGIAGILVFCPEDNPYGDTADKVVAAMADAQKHRGPDHGDIWCDSSRGVYLGHRRLAIVDLTEDANQPMANDDGTVVLVFNGEIYNAAELRRAIEKDHTFAWKTAHSDTEVLLRAYEAWGDSFLHRLRGMFAFALWDAKAERLLLARDRLGIKPLYYTQNGRRIAFASEIKALLEDPLLEKSPNPSALCHYLSFYVSPPPDTAFLGVSKLEPGSLLEARSDGSVVVKKWWDLVEAARPVELDSVGDYATLVREELQASVEIHKLSDVPVGVFLSGGLDSSANAYFFAQGEPLPIKTFSVGYAGNIESYVSEYAYARLMAETVGARHYEVDVTKLDLAANLQKMAAQLDEPLADPVAAAIYFVSDVARNEGVSVAQVGEGSDELFCGYRSWRAVIALERYARRALGLGLGLRAPMEMLARVAQEDDDRPSRWIRRMAEGRPAFWGGAEGFSDDEKRLMLRGEMLEAAQRSGSWEVVEPFWKRFSESRWASSPMQWLTYLDLSFRVPELLLMRVDKMAMAVSLEARVPFLDHRFVEVVFGIPEKIKIRHLEPKYILRRAVSGLLPPEILKRKKQGFAVPISEWLAEERFRGFARSVLERFSKESGFLRPEVASEAPLWGDKRKLWILLLLGLWWEAYFSDTPTDISQWFPELGGPLSLSPPPP